MRGFKKTMENQGKTQKIVKIEKLYFVRGNFVMIVEKKEKIIYIFQCLGSGSFQSGSGSDFQVRIGEKSWSDLEKSRSCEKCYKLKKN